MSVQSLSHHSGSTLAPRPVFDVLVERAARKMLAWANRRASKTVVSHERMSLLIANERTRSSGGSAIGR